jgi:hypothetical protein
MSFQYLILFPFGQDGYRIDLKMLHPKGNWQAKWEKISMWKIYQIQERYNRSDTLLKGGRLFQQFLVNCYATVKEDQLDYIRKNQKNFRCDAYKDIYMMLHQEVIMTIAM